MNGLLVTADQVAAINAALPTRIRVSPIHSDTGALYLGVDLLTDCGPEGTYAAAQSLLEALTPAEFTPNPALPRVHGQVKQ